MGQSLVKNYLHIVFSTKHRLPAIQAPFDKELYAYIGGLCNALESHVIIVGGYVDHIHILCMLSKKIALIKLVEKIKSHSSKWMKTKDVSLKNFYWQDGYGAFSVNPRDIAIVKTYIKNQHEHHKNQTFQEEYRLYLEKNTIEYDERYIWD